MNARHGQHLGKENVKYWWNRQIKQSSQARWNQEWRDSASLIVRELSSFFGREKIEFLLLLSGLRRGRKDKYQKFRQEKERSRRGEKVKGRQRWRCTSTLSSIRQPAVCLGRGWEQSRLLGCPSASGCWWRPRWRWRQHPARYGALYKVTYDQLIHMFLYKHFNITA